MGTCISSSSCITIGNTNSKVEIETSSSLLSQLRHQPTRILDDGRCHHGVITNDRMEFMWLIIRHQSEFPMKLREVIKAAANAPAGFRAHRFHQTVYDALVSLLLCKTGSAYRKVGGSRYDYESIETAVASAELAQWVGFDSAVDIEEEVEVAIRAYPGVLRACLVFRNMQRKLQPIIWSTYCWKAISFVPLLAELGHELNDGLEAQEREGLIWTGIYTTFPIVPVMLQKVTTLRECEDDHDEDEDEDVLGNQLADAYFSVLVRLKDKGLFGNKDVYSLLHYIHTGNTLNSIQGNKMFRYLLNRDPTLLEVRYTVDDPNSNACLLQQFLDRCRVKGVRNDLCFKLERFQIIIEVGMAHYPEEIGFLFHTGSHVPVYCTGFVLNRPRSSFDIACQIFGMEPVIKVMEEVLRNSTLVDQQVRSDVMRNLLLVMATNENVLLDGLYFLFRRHPTALFH